MKRHLFQLVIPILFLSCSTQNQIVSNTVQIPDLLNYSILNGNYENGVDDDPHVGLWRDLKANRTHFQKKVATINTYVAIKMLDTETLQVQLCSDGQELDKFELKGSADKRYFHIRPRTNFIPIPFFLWTGENRTAIGNDLEGNLILLQSQYDWYYLFFLLETEDYDFIDATYPKIQRDTISLEILKPKTDLRF